MNDYVQAALRSSILRALLAGCLGTALAWAGEALTPEIFTTLNHAYYDSWVQSDVHPPLNSNLVLVTRDETDNSRFGGGPLDRAHYARLIEALHRAGAKLVALDLKFDEPSPPERGGAASDALLAETVTRTNNVIFPYEVQLPSSLRKRNAENTREGLPVHSSWPRLEPGVGEGWLRVLPLGTPISVHGMQSMGIGHRVVIPDKDGVVRRAPIVVVQGDRVIPAFGLTLAQGQGQGQGQGVEAFSSPKGKSTLDHVATLPIDSTGTLLVRFLSHPSGEPFDPISLSTVMEAIAEGKEAQLQDWVQGKVVLVLGRDKDRAFPTSVGREMTVGLVQAHLFYTLLDGPWIKNVSARWKRGIIWVMSVLAAWCLFSVRAWAGAALALGVAVIYVGGVVVVLSLGGLVLPLFSPLWSLSWASAGAAVWMYLTSGGTIQQLEKQVQRVQQELSQVRETLVTKESAVESLEEDVATAQEARTQSVGKAAELVRSEEQLRGQCAEAQVQEDLARQRVYALERELAGLRAVTMEPGEITGSTPERLRDECVSLGIVTRDPKVLQLFRDVKKAARSSLSVLIHGEPGTGKELFARALHLVSPRSQKPFIAVNMAAISPDLFESELFGHVKGSFSGAGADRKGFFELAHEGTLFLDEIGDLQLEHQGKLLRVLQDRTFYRVGATEPTTVDVRIVAATNKDLSREVSRGVFREDLYFRIKGLVLHLPPLRERPSDIPILATSLVRDAAVQAERPDLHLSQEAFDEIVARPWYGNIRELQHCLQQAVALAEGAVITKEDLRLDPAPVECPTGVFETGILQGDSSSDEAVLSCLRTHEFDMKTTARALGWDRGTVTQRLKGMGFNALIDMRGDYAQAALRIAGGPSLAGRVEVKLKEYHQHLLHSIQSFESPISAIAACRKRFKNLPDRHFQSVELLIQQWFDRSPPS